MRQATTTTTTTTKQVTSPKVITGELKQQREAFCIKCRARHIINDGKKIDLKNGRTAFKGTCSNCKKIVCTLIKKTE